MRTPCYTDLTGKKFGRLTVLEFAGHNKYRAALWRCRCDCGNEKIVRAGGLVSGETRSCGCLQRETARNAIKSYNASDRYVPPTHFVHGMNKTPLHNAWCRMRARCNNAKKDHYDRYGGRGIKVCPEWEKDFMAFRDWAIANGYEEGLEIDRVDNDGDYAPDNCRWVSRKQQVRNRGNTLYYEHNGTIKPFAEWAEEYDVPYKLAHARYKKGWPFERIFACSMARLDMQKEEE